MQDIKNIAGMSPERLTNINNHLNHQYIQKGKIAGTVTLVYRRGEVTYFDAQGMMDVERNKAMQKDTLFRIYSMTKPITSIAMMQLYEQGKFQLSDPVHRFIPEWKGLRVYESGRAPLMATTRPERPMQIHDLFTHMSGLTYGFSERTNVDAMYRKKGIGTFDLEPQGNLQDMINDLAKLPLEFSPGSRWNYSVSTDVLGYLIEKISGQPLDNYLQDNIFTPLGMKDTGFYIPKDKQSRFSACYMRGGKGELALQDDPQDSYYLSKPDFLSGGGGLISTAGDYLQFCKMLLNKGQLDGHQIISKKTLEFMTTNHLPNGCDLGSIATGAFSESLYDGVGFGLGFSVALDPTKSKTIASVGEYAWGGAASTAFWIDPEEDMAVVFMTQLLPSSTYNFRGQLKQLIYGAIVD